ncbi:MAG: peptidylprolyl isomerase [Rikenellaceae bacterium]|jgi:cyclophilin family peptidyl-prolyl cis-trans isomerase|nr:peptidylprolyl isomerase [Rikenellaceae bacterium]
MIRFCLIALLTLFCLQDSDIWAKTKEGPSPAEEKAAEAVIRASGTGETRVVISTSMGKIEVMLYDQTPLHRDNFVRLAEDKSYNGVLFHRVIEDFMIQAGDPTSKMSLYTAVYGATSAGDPIPAEIRGDLFHHRGALAAARMPDEVNPERESSGSQFYIVTGQIQTDSLLSAKMQQMGVIIPPERAEVYKTIGGTPELDGAYTVFGRVIKGQKVVDKIAALSTDYRDRPRRDVYIKQMKVRHKGKK